MKRCFGLLLLILVPGCGPSALGKVALKEDLPSLQRAIEKEQHAGRIDLDALKDLAQAVARRELASSSGDSGVARVRDLRSCVTPLEDDFQSRAEHEDVVGAAAALALLESGKLDPEELVQRYGNSQDPAWLAVAARASVGAARSELRRQFFLDPDLRVRRAALRAAFQGLHPQDKDALFDVARRDPDALARSLAIQTLGALGGEDVVMRLKDLWTGADTRTRQVIVGAWAKPMSVTHGGEAQLVWALESDTGLPSLVAARALLVQNGAHAQEGLARLLRALKDGTDEEQLLAVGSLPLDDKSLGELQRFAKQAPASVKVRVYARLAEQPKLKAQAIAELKKLLSSKQQRVKLDARAALAHLGVQEVEKEATAELHVKDPHLRQRAAMDLLALKAYSAAAPGLGDSVAAVRTQLACTVLSQM